MKNRPLKTPSYCLHKATGQAVVRIDGKDYYLGRHGSEESRAEFDRLIAEWLNNGRRLAPLTSGEGQTVAELILAYWRWAEGYHRDEHGNPRGELENVRTALVPLRRLYGHTQALSFGPLALRAIQGELVKSGLSRGVVNGRINRIRHVFKWAVSFQLIPSSVHESLRTVPGLKRGRSEAKETDPVQPVPVAVVDATLPYMPAPVRAMVELQLLVGCRPSEAMTMRAIDLNTSKDVWEYRPAHHKNKHRGHDRVIFLGPKAQAIVKPFLTTNVEAFLFSPRAYVAELHERRRQERKSKRTPSQLKRQRKPKPKRKPGERYRRGSYRYAVTRATDKATQARILELLKTLAEAGKPVSFSCVLRWIQRGIPGPDRQRVKLEGVRVGGRWLTSREALARWAERLTPRLDGEPAPVPRTPSQRRKAAERAERELDEARIK
jgi:site-specific recombinase XerD